MSINKKVAGDFKSIEGKVRQSLQNHGFTVVTEMDLKNIYKNKLGVDYHNYVILGACNSNMSYKALQIDPDMGLLMPCNVVVSEEEDGVLISAINPKTMIGMMQNELLNEVADIVTEDLQKAISEI
ncbi:MAG: hypothetical protein A2Y18_03065 [Clostridiales bacterium GWD2_32_19]|nr:MAG: hypothetical protein A2Y18_03065 [Clostridiales bacterium GWD2_32_19]